MTKTLGNQSCVCLCAFACFMCCPVSKLIGRDPKIQMDMFRVKKFGYESPSTTIRVLEENPNVGHKSTKAAPIDDPCDAPLEECWTVSGVCGSIISHGILTSTLRSLSTEPQSCRTTSSHHLRSVGSGCRSPSAVYAMVHQTKG